MGWSGREEVPLDGPKFGKFSGRTTTMLCGGTLVFDDTGTVLWWAMKPGSLPYGGKRQRGGSVRAKWDKAVANGRTRRQAVLENLARGIAEGSVGTIAGSGQGLLGSHTPPIIAEEDSDNHVRFTLSPHFNLSSERRERDVKATGERRWQISC